MDNTPPADVTLLLQKARAGDAAASEQLAPIVYDRLRELAAKLIRREAPGHSVQTTMLVNDAYMALVGAGNVEWQSRAHFFATAARAMRRMLIDSARARSAIKRGGDWERVTLSDAPESNTVSPAELLAIDEALDRLAARDRRLADIVELRFFGGLQVHEIALVLKVSERSVGNYWNIARAWLHRELSGQTHG